MKIPSQMEVTLQHIQTISGQTDGLDPTQKASPPRVVRFSNPLASFVITCNKQKDATNKKLQQRCNKQQRCSKWKRYIKLKGNKEKECNNRKCVMNVKDVTNGKNTINTKDAMNGKDATNAKYTF